MMLMGHKTRLSDSMSTCTLRCDPVRDYWLTVPVHACLASFVLETLVTMGM